MTDLFTCPRGRHIRNRIGIAEKIINLSKQHHKIRNVYKETLRSLINAMGVVEYIDQNDAVQKVKSFHGRQERAIASQIRKNNLILPAIAVANIRTEQDPNRRRYEPNLVIRTVKDDEKVRAVRIVSLAPKPINLTYKVSVWAKYVEDLNQISEQINLMFNPNLDLEITNSNLLKAFITDESDDSDFIVGDGADRIVRNSFTISVEGYLSNPEYMITNTGEIEAFNLDTTIVT